MDIDEALDFVGGYRRWHVGMFIALGISLFLPLAWQGLSGVFIGKTILKYYVEFKFTCLVLERNRNAQ